MQTESRSVTLHTYCLLTFGTGDFKCKFKPWSNCLAETEEPLSSALYCIHCTRALSGFLLQHNTLSSSGTTSSVGSSVFFFLAASLCKQHVLWCKLADSS